MIIRLILTDMWSIQKYVMAPGYKTTHSFVALYATRDFSTVKLDSILLQ